MKIDLCFVISMLVLLVVRATVEASQGLSSIVGLGLGYSKDDLHSDDRISGIFELWRSRHGKSYHSLEEKAKRLHIFKQNLFYIDSHNSKKSSSHFLGLNRFADLTNEEFKRLYTGKLLNRKRSDIPQRPSSCDAPSSLDWRNKGAVTAVKDQGSCGGCWAFSVTGAIEGINEITTGELVSLSEQELIDCDTSNYGCDGGNMDYAFEWVIQNGGIDTETDYPYTGTDGTCNATKEETKVVSIDGYTDVAQSDSALLCAVVQQPITIGIDGSAFDFQLYSGGIYDGSCSDNPDDIDHAVLIVGYGSEDGENYWIVKNSWGTSWGINGYIYIKRDTSLKYGVCAINAMASYPTKTSSPWSPTPEPSPAVSPPPPPSQPPPTPTPPPPPPPPSPSPVDCGGFTYCPAGDTCCCLFEVGSTCFIYGCCELPNAVCCSGTIYCCPSDYPICDVWEGLCLQSSRDIVGVEMKKRKRAHYKLPWTKHSCDAHSQDGQLPSLKFRRHAVE